MKKKKGRFSRFIRPILSLYDLVIVNLVILYHLNFGIKGLYFSLLASFAWMVISAFTSFYKIYRFTPEIKIFTLIFKQYFVFTLVLFALIGFFESTDFLILTYPLFSANQTIIISTLVIAIVASFKFVVYYLLLKFRVVFGGNYRKTIIIGSGLQAENLQEYFNNKKEAGFKLKKIFDSKNINLNTICSYILEESIDEVYCCLSTVDPQIINEITNFSESNLKEVKYIPSYGKIYSKKLSYQNYGLIPVLSLRTIHLEDNFNSFIKRSFDILFSTLVLVFLLSWLIPLLAIVIKINSRGPVFFKQKRNGYNFREFWCYKFRSMKLNREANTSQATKNDYRVTSVGKYLRKFSIDELPQFFNVLVGDMSVVGPRPHMLKENEKYKSTIDKFMVRHYVKPGITGLAQTKGFRGEIETNHDIVNRIKYDIYYIENWSFMLDLKIIIETVINVIRGEKKAY
jgi:putative colanic acid biosynthesis UDP-glucose lipid carrier transferase